MSEIERVFTGIATVVKQSDSTTKLFAVALLAGITFLTAIALNQADGILRIVVVIAALVIILVTVTLAGSLERTRIVQGNTVIDKTTVSVTLHSQKKEYDVFISAPMETSLDGKGNVIGRDQIMQIKRHLESVCRFSSIFYASADKVSKREFDNNSVALSKNFQILAASKRHIFVFPERKPSSTLVEVGMALALGIPSFWFVKNDVKLPFLLQQAWQRSDTNSELPKIIVCRYSNINDILRYISDCRDKDFV